MIRLLALINTTRRDEYRRLMTTIISVLVTTVIGVLLIITFEPSPIAAMWLCIIPWAFSGYRIFCIRRIVLVHIAGEVIDVVGNRSGGLPNDILDNTTMRSYISILTNIWLFQTILFLGIPLLINNSDWSIGYLAPMIMLGTAILLFSTRLFVVGFKMAAVAIILFLVIATTWNLFPQLGHYTGVHSSPLMSTSSARTANEIEKLRKEQIEQKNINLLKEALEWQKKNPTKDLPLHYQEVIEAAEKGLSVEQLRAKKAAASIAKATTPRKVVTQTQTRTVYVPAPATTSVVTTVSKPSMPKISSTAVITKWKVTFTDPDTQESFKDEVIMTRDGDSITMVAKHAKTVFKGTRQDEKSGWFSGKMSGGGDPDGTFTVFVGRMSANGSWLTDRSVAFKMERKG